jgi:serine O-acetyltransferase
MTELVKGVGAADRNGSGKHDESRAEPLNFQERLVDMMRRRGTRSLAYKALKLLGVEIPPDVSIGRGFRLAHGAPGLVISVATVIGDNVKVFQGVTLGFADEYLRPDQLPTEMADIGGIVLEDDVVIGAGAKVLFKCGETLVVGRGAIVGANAVVLKSVPAGEVWAGVPARKVGTNPNVLNLTDAGFASPSVSG